MIKHWVSALVSVGSLAIFGTSNGQLIVMDAHHKAYERLKVCDSAITCVSINGDILVAGSSGGHVFVYCQLELLQTLDIEQVVVDVSLSHRGAKMVVCTRQSL